MPGCMSAWKKLSRKTWGEEDFDAAFGQYFEVGAGGVDGGFVGDVGGADALHHHHVFAAVAPVHFGHVQERRVFEVGAQFGWRSPLQT